MSSSPATDERDDPSGGRGGFGRWLWLGAAVLCFVVFAQHYFGVGFKKTIEIDINSLVSDTGHAWKLKLPREHRTHAARFHLKMFEDGVAIGPNEISNKRVRQHGSGRYRLDENGTLRLSASDNSSPVFNARKYSFEIPARVPPLELAVAVVLLLGASLAARRWRGPAVSKRALALRRPGLIALGVLVLAIAVRIWAMGACAGYSDGGFAVKGIPYSDALAWTELAHSLREGNGFQGSFAGQRPFYSVFIAAAYRVFGESLQTGKAVNVACGALSVVFLLLMVAHSTGKWSTGLIAAAALLFAQQQLHDVQLLITEPMGLTLIIAGAYAWWAGLLTLNPCTLFAAGALIGLSNITRTFTMLGLPLFAFIVLAACLSRKLDWKRTVLICAMFTLGATCALAPWMIRQKIRYDTFALSTAGSDLLYSAAADSPGWNTAQYDELEAEGIKREQHGEVNAYFSKRYAEKVNEAPGRYINRLVTWIFEYVAYHDFGNPLTRLLVLSGGFLWGLRAWWNGRALLGGVCFLGAAGLAPLIGQVPPEFVLVMSAALALWLGNRASRWSIVVLLATLFSGALMSAMIGNFGMNRTSPLTGWVFTAILFIGLEAVASRLIDGRAEAVEGKSPQFPGVWKGLPGGLAWGLIAVAGLAAMLVAFTGFANEGNIATVPALDASHQTRVRDWLREELPIAKEAPEETFFVSLARLEPYRAYIRAKEDTSHWARPFLPRDYGRTVALVRVLPGDAPGGSLMAVQFRGRAEKVPEDETMVLAGVYNIDNEAPLGHDVTMVEALVLLPYSTTDQELIIDFDNAITFPVTPEAATIMAGGEQ